LHLQGSLQKTSRPPQCSRPFSQLPASNIAPFSPPPRLPTTSQMPSPNAQTVCLLLAALLAGLCLGEPITFHTACGDVVGVRESLPSLAGGPDESYAAFYGIPYAAPPVGMRRFRPAEPFGCWNGTLDATALRPACFQTFGTGNLPQGESEDCLTLNVYVPDVPTEQPLPVHFWIYGGSNVEGFQTSYPGVLQLMRAGSTDGDALTAVVVVANYRLGAFGFLALKELSATDPRGVSGNYAITDLVRALEWTQKHISSFGGDPGMVNLIGQSSGGTNIFGLLACPDARGLFHSTISLSGSPSISMPLHAAEEQNIDILEAFGCTSDVLSNAEAASSVLDCLFSLPSETIAYKLPQAYGSTAFLPESTAGISWKVLVIVDGVTVAHPIAKAVALPIHDVPNIFQTQQCETDILTPNVTQHSWSVPHYKEWLSSFLTSKGWSADAGSALAALYKDYEESAELMYEGWLSDMGATCGNQLIGLASTSNAQAPNYIGFVVRRPDNPFFNSDGNPVHYAFHLWDYIAATNSWSQLAGGDVPPYEPTDGDRAFGRLLRRIWGAFARHDYAWLMAAGWRPAGQAGAVGVFEGERRVASRAGYLQARCAALAAPPLGMGAPFWWVN